MGGGGGGGVGGGGGGGGEREGEGEGEGEGRWYRQRLITLSGEHNPCPEAQFKLESAGIELHGEEATGGTVGPNNMDIQVNNYFKNCN